jgi:hypothetical protein
MNREQAREPASDELVRAHAELVRARAAAVEFGRTERAWLLAADLALTTLLAVFALALLIAALAFLVIALFAGEMGLAGPNAVGALALAWAVLRAAGARRLAE